MKKSLCLALASFAFAAGSAHAQFGLGDLAVLRVGNGTETLASTGNSIFIDDYTTGGLLQHSFAVADSGASSLIISGAATSEGALSRSGDGTSLAFGGYNTPQPFSSSVAGSSSSAVPRGVGVVSANGNYTLAATSSTAYNQNNIRSAVSDGANNFWTAGANTGTAYFGNTAAPAVIQSSNTNTRVINIFSGSLYYSTASGTTTRGIYKISGTPTSPTVGTQIINTGSSSSPYDFAINAAGTLAYIADDTASSAGGIQRWDFNGSAWTLTYTLGTGAANIGARGLAVDFSGASAVIFATTAEGTADRIIEITDTGAGSSATTLATSSANELFRGLDFAPVPEPGTWALLGLGSAVLLVLRRKR